MECKGRWLPAWQRIEWSLSPRPQPHARVADDRTQARPPLLPRTARARPRRPGTDPDPLTTARPTPPRPPLPDDHRSSGQLPAATAAPTPTRWRPQQRPSGRSQSTPTDRSIMTSPTTTKSRTQIGPSIHGANQHTQRNHSPPQPFDGGLSSAVARHDAVRYGPRTTPRVDLHPVVFDAAGDGWQKLPEGGCGLYPVEGLRGGGEIAGRPVPCSTPELQLRHRLRLPALRCRPPRPRAARGPLRLAAPPPLSKPRSPCPRLNRPGNFRPAALRLSRRAPDREGRSAGERGADRCRRWPGGPVCASARAVHRRVPGFGRRRALEHRRAPGGSPHGSVSALTPTARRPVRGAR
jgi:hypothetical protein